MVRLTPFKNKDLDFYHNSKFCCDSGAQTFIDNVQGNIYLLQENLLENNVNSAGYYDTVPLNEYVMTSDSIEPYDRHSNPTRFVWSTMIGTLKIESDACNCDWIPDCSC